MLYDKRNDREELSKRLSTELAVRSNGSLATALYSALSTDGLHIG